MSRNCNIFQACITIYIYLSLILYAGGHYWIVGQTDIYIPCFICLINVTMYFLIICFFFFLQILYSLQMLVTVSETKVYFKT